MNIKEIMTAEPLVAEVPGTRRDVVRLLVQHNVSGLPVVKEGTRELVGVVTRSDVFNNPGQEQLALIMTSDPVTLTPEDDVSEAARIFHERRIHGIPVVEGNNVVGVVSPSDILKVLSEPKGRQVREFMASGTASLFQETPLPVAWEIMRLADCNALPVLDDRSRLVGVVADSDLFKTNDVEEKVGRRELGFDNSEDDWDWDQIRDIAPLFYVERRIDLPAKPVKDLMVRDVITVFSQTDVADAARKMSKNRINQLPVVDSNDRIVGMITDFDLMRAW